MSRFTFIVSLCWAVSAFAHDPGLSGVEIRVDAGQPTAHVMFTKHNADVLGQSGVLELTVDGKPLTEVQRRSETDNKDVVHISIDYAPVTGTQLRARSLVFDKLPRTHRQYITVLQDGTKLRSEEHTSELQSPHHLLCRLLLE